MADLPVPPVELRALVGPQDPAAFDNPTGAPVLPGFPAERVFDFGCGCGRTARQLIQQHEPPERYDGVDLHRGMIDWCNEHLAPHAPQFGFHHLDIANVHLNPGGTAEELPFPVADQAYSLVLAHSVFTHIVQERVPFWLGEVARVLEPGGVFHATWFTFDRREHPMLRDDQHALYIDHYDPTHATIFDRAWIRAQAAAVGLTITSITPPDLRGYHWYLDMTPTAPGVVEAAWPPDSTWLGNQHHPERWRFNPEPATEEQVRWLYRFGLGREPSEADVAVHAGAPLPDVLAAFMASPEADVVAARRGHLPVG